MTRYLAILVLMIAGLPRLGVGLSMGRHDEAEAACHRVIKPMACCGGGSGEDAYCPMSDGPCRCLIAPAPDPEPRPQLPLPRSDRDFFTSLPNEPTEITLLPEPLSTPLRPGSRVGLTGSKSHNQLQALLGIWRT